MSLIVFSAAFAQSEEEREKSGLVPHELKLGVNVVRAGVTYLGSGRDSNEFEAAVGVGGLNVVIDYGIEENRQAGAFSYTNKGNYYRVGIDRNFIKDKESGNALSLGLRYARANFEDELTYSLSNDFGEQAIQLSNPDLKSRWLELAFGLRGKVVSNLYMGLTLRWQFARAITGEGDLKTYDIPGFGNTNRQNSTAFDYYFMWRIPFFK